MVAGYTIHDDMSTSDHVQLWTDFADNDLFAESKTAQPTVDKLRTGDPRSEQHYTPTEQKQF